MCLKNHEIKQYEKQIAVFYVTHFLNPLLNKLASISDPPSLAEGVLGCIPSLLMSSLWGSQSCFSEGISWVTHYDLLTFLLTLLCQKAWMGKDDKLCWCLGVFFGIFGVEAYAAISSWIPAFLLTNGYWKVFVSPAVCGASFLPSQCSSAVALCISHCMPWTVSGELGACFITLVTWSVDCHALSKERLAVKHKSSQAKRKCSENFYL